MAGGINPFGFAVSAPQPAPRAPIDLPSAPFGFAPPPSKWEQTAAILNEYNPIDAFWRLYNSDMAKGGSITDQNIEDGMMVGGTVMGGGAMIPKPANALNMGIKAFRAGADKGRGDMTFYALERRGAEPYSVGGNVPINEVELNPSNIFDAKNGDGVKLYKEFLAETGHPGGYGRNGLPFWTVADDLASWLKSKGHDYDAIKFDENTGVPSIAILNKQNGVDAALEQVQAKYPDVKLDVYATPKGLTLSRIEVPKEARNQGVGSAVMKDLTALADENGLPFALSPSGDFGGSVSRLKEFYQRFGFVPNKGRNKDFSISESYIRYPSGESK